MQSNYLGSFFISQIPWSSPEILSQQLGVGPGSLPISQVALENWGRRLQSPVYRRYEYVGSIGRIAKRTEKGNLCSGMLYLEEKGVFFEVSFLANLHVSWSETKGVWKCKKEQQQRLSHHIWRKNFALCLNIWHNWDRVWHKVVWGQRRKWFFLHQRASFCASWYWHGVTHAPAAGGTPRRCPTCPDACRDCCSRRNPTSYWRWKGFNDFQKYCEDFLDGERRCMNLRSHNWMTQSQKNISHTLGHIALCFLRLSMSLAQTCFSTNSN